MENKMARQKAAWIAVLAVALTAMLLLAACTPSQGPPAIEKNLLEIGTINSLTGAGSRADQLYLSGQMDYIRYFNDQKMIPGITVQLLWRDSARSVDRWISSYQVFR